MGIWVLYAGERRIEMPFSCYPLWKKFEEIGIDDDKLLKLRKQYNCISCISKGVLSRIHNGNIASLNTIETLIEFYYKYKRNNRIDIIDNVFNTQDAIRYVPDYDQLKSRIYDIEDNEIGFIRLCSVDNFVKYYINSCRSESTDMYLESICAYSIIQLEQETDKILKYLKENKILIEDNTSKKNEINENFEEHIKSELLKDRAEYYKQMKKVQEAYDSIVNKKGRPRNGIRGSNATMHYISAKFGLKPYGAYRRIQFGRGLDNAEKVYPGFTDMILNCKIYFRTTDVANLRNKKGFELEQAIQDIIDGKTFKNETIESNKPHIVVNERIPTDDEIEAIFNEILARGEDFG